MRRGTLTVPPHTPPPSEILVVRVYRQSEAARRPPNIIIISYFIPFVNPPVVQTSGGFFMEHSVLKIRITGCNMKIQKRSESNVQVNFSQNHRKRG